MTPDPVGLPGVDEAPLPSQLSDMRTAVEVFVEREFGVGGAYDPDPPGP